MSKTVSRRDFLAGAAAGTMGVASLSGMVAANVAKADEAPAATGTYDIMSQFSTYNHGENPDKVAPTTPEEFIISKGDGVLAAGGMAIGMALSGTVQNFAGGIMLLVFKPFKAGDFIEAQGFSGTVSEVNIVSTKLRTTDNRTIVLPNGALSGGTINNISQNPTRRVEWKIGVEYGSDTEKAREILLGLLNDDKRVLTGPDAPELPSMKLSGLMDSSIELQLRCWVKTEDYWDVLYDTNEKIYISLPQNGISFPFPQLDVHIRRGE